MTADIDPHSKADAGEDTELPGVILVVVLLAVLMTLVLLFG